MVFYGFRVWVFLNVFFKSRYLDLLLVLSVGSVVKASSVLEHNSAGNWALEHSLIGKKKNMSLLTTVHVYDYVPLVK